MNQEKLFFWVSGITLVIVLIVIRAVYHSWWALLVYLVGFLIIRTIRYLLEVKQQ